LVDLADVVDDARLLRAVESAERNRLLNVNELRSLLRNSPGRRGLKLLHKAAEGYESGDTRSELERQFLQLCRRQGLPIPSMNAWVAGFATRFCNGRAFGCCG